MAIRKMKLVNIVIPQAHTQELVRELLLSESMEFIDAKKMIDETTFLLSAALEHAPQISEMEDVRPATLSYDFSGALAKLKEITEVGGYTPKLDKDVLLREETLFDGEQTLEELYGSLRGRLDTLEEAKAEREALEPLLLIARSGLSELISPLRNLAHFGLRLGTVDRMAYARLKRNAQSIPPLFLHLGSESGKELCLFIYPQILEVESERVFRSLRLEEWELDSRFVGLSQEELEQKDRELQARIQSTEEELREFAQTRQAQIDRAYSRLLLEKRIADSLRFISSSQNFSYVSVWSPTDRVPFLEELIERLGGVMNVLSSLEAEAYDAAPTQLSNHPFVRPFELLVTMYGTPSYRESDPTTFFAIVYMFLFGAMFGDLGQGLVIALAGLLLRKKTGMFGSLLTRLGMASMLFGFFYDSLFGYENVLSRLIPLPVFFHPFENTDTVLIAAMLFGLVLLTLSYAIGFYNKIQLGLYQEAYFGHAGLAGYTVFAGFLLKAGEIAGAWRLPSWIGWALVLGGIAAMLFAEPLYSLLTGRRPLYTEKAGNYYVEQSFGILETLLSIFSSALSFIRVGAFALNHVGLFVAFHTLADMIGGAAGSIAMGILGNLLIIALEGLVVFIQGLRLLYYELFSKSFVGEGTPFKAAHLKEES